MPIREVCVNVSRAKPLSIGKRWIVGTFNLGDIPRLVGIPRTLTPNVKDATSTKPENNTGTAKRLI